MRPNHWNSEIQGLAAPQGEPAECSASSAACRWPMSGSFGGVADVPAGCCWGLTGPATAPLRSGLSTAGPSPHRAQSVKQASSARGWSRRCTQGCQAPHPTAGLSTHLPGGRVPTNTTLVRRLARRRSCHDRRSCRAVHAEDAEEVAARKRVTPDAFRRDPRVRLRRATGGIWT